MPNLTGKQIAGILLQAGGRGLGQYFDQKQLEEQKRLQAEDREWMKTVRGWRKEDRARDVVEAKREQQTKQRAQSFLKILSGDSPFAPEIPDVNIQRQEAFDILGRTAPPTIGAGALKEHLIQAGTPEPTAELARLRELGIAPKAPKEPTDLDDWVSLSLNPERTAGEQLRFQALDKRFGKDDKAKVEVEKQRVKLKSDQKQWDKDVRQYVTSSFNRENFPRTIEVLDKYGATVIGRKQAPKNWKTEDPFKKEWPQYLMELNRVRNVFGVRPVITETQTLNVNQSIVDQLRAKGYSEEEIREATQ